ncbi:MAG: alpha/beta hydrolase, partial [Planctomycetes bacterium]|nr:alpha/beta hydrolase [Planctomycetota bacterium]
IFDYRGYGSSQGKPTEEGTYLDAQAAFDWLGTVKGVPSEEIILFGRSLGGSVAAHLAQTAKPAGLVLESSFTSYIDLGKKFYPYLPVSWFASFNYNTLEYIDKVTCPILVIHSRNDELIPFEFGLRLYNAANEPKEFIEIFGSHNDGFLFSGEVYRQGWSQWLDFVKSCKPAAHAALKRIS